MLNAIRTWYVTYQNEITWFIVGLLFANMIQHLAEGKLLWALWDLTIGAVNVYLWKTSRVR